MKMEPGALCGSCGCPLNGRPNQFSCLNPDAHESELERQLAVAQGDLRNLGRRFFFLKEAIEKTASPESIAFQLRRMDEAFDDAGVKVSHDN